LQIKRQESRTGQKKSYLIFIAVVEIKIFHSQTKQQVGANSNTKKKRTEKTEKKPQANPNSNNAVFINIQLRAWDR